MPNFGYHLARAEGRAIRAIYAASLRSIVRRAITPPRDLPFEVYAYSGESALPEQIASIRSLLRHAGRPKKITIVSDGTYSAPNVPVGEAQVLVSAMDPKFEAKMSELAGRSPDESGKSTGRGKLQVGGAAPPGGDFQAQYTLVDSKFNSYESSGLKVNVSNPETTYDIPVTKTKR